MGDANDTNAAETDETSRSNDEDPTQQIDRSSDDHANPLAREGGVAGMTSARESEAERARPG